ncbi:MAG TPA: flagellar hook-basal body complex protein FliE [Opitutales bacterium]|nr:flagellar hook-basal body complex protein FliE [Opitutales bacterium]
MSLIESLQNFGGYNLFGAGKTQASNPANMMKDMQEAINTMSPQNVAKASQDAGASLSSGIGGDGRSIFAEVRPASGGDSFASSLTGFIDSVDARTKIAEQANTDIMTGKSDNIHQAMISMQEASISFDLLVQVRNKLVDSYKELSRISV